MPFDVTDLPILTEQHLPRNWSMNQSRRTRRKRRGRSALKQDKAGRLRTRSVAVDGGCCTDHKFAQLSCPEGQARISAGNSLGLPWGINEHRSPVMNLALLLSFYFLLLFPSLSGYSGLGFCELWVQPYIQDDEIRTSQCSSSFFICQVLFHFLFTSKVI